MKAPGEPSAKAISSISHWCFIIFLKPMIGFLEQHQEARPFRGVFASIGSLMETT